MLCDSMTGRNNKQSNANGHQQVPKQKNTQDKNEYLTPESRIIQNNAILKTIKPGEVNINFTLTSLNAGLHSLTVLLYNISIFDIQ